MTQPLDGRADPITQLRKIWILSLVVEKKGFREAALRAHVTRSAISQTITHLEKLHGKALLIRRRGDVRPTDYCIELLRKAQPVLESLSAIAPDLSAPSLPKISWLDLGAYESLAIDIVPSLLQRLSYFYPNIRVQVRVGRSSLLSTMVRRGELCMAIVIENDQMRGLSVTPLLEDRLGFYVARSLPRTLRGWQALQSLPLGTIASGASGPARFLARFLKSAGLRKPATFTSDSMEALLEAAAFGSIVGVLPARVAARRSADLIEITPPAGLGKDTGRHRICLINRPNCDEKENDFLAEQIRTLLADRRGMN